jgi:hypothetical protein
MPKYTLLIYNPVEGRPSPDQLIAEMPRWGEYTQRLKDDGVYVNGDALQGVEVATTVRERGGETQITDGPFAETKEQLGGFYVVECPDLDTALRYAGDMPSIGYGSVEVRPVWDTSQMPTSADQLQTQA